MPVPLLDLQRQYAAIKGDIDAALCRVVSAQRFILGPEVEQLEAAIAEYVGSKHAIGCASGTDAILLSLKALPLEPGDEVIVPAFTFFATAGAVWNAALKPVFADSDARSFNMTADCVRPHITKRTRAIVVVHLYGQMTPMHELMSLAAEHGLYVIEDAAQSLGARQVIGGRERHAGTIGTTGTYSFFPSKNLGGFGDGGLIVTDDDTIAGTLRKLRVHGGRQMYQHELVGTNSRLDALQAAVLSAKLRYLDGWAERRRGNAAYYDAAFARHSSIVVPFSEPGNFHVYNQYTLRVQDRDALKRKLDDAGIGNAIYYPLPLHLQECFAALGYKRGALPKCELAAQEVISIPVFPELSDAERAEVVYTISTFYE